MLALKYLLVMLSLGIFATAAGIVSYDVYAALQLNWLLAGKKEEHHPGREWQSSLAGRRPFGSARWKQAALIGLASPAPFPLALSIFVLPDGSAGIRVSELSGVRPDTSDPVLHFLKPLVDGVAFYDTREQVFTTAANGGSKSKSEVLILQAGEGLSLGRAVAMRYRLDPFETRQYSSKFAATSRRACTGSGYILDLPPPCPRYETREVFALKSEDVRSKAAQAIKTRPATDGTVVRGQLLRDIQLPAE
jgi:hypothetical protein